MYYPKSQIKPNLYTDGKFYVLFSTKELYTGYYYEVSNGQLYTGRNPQDGPNILLIPIDDKFSNVANVEENLEIPSQIITFENSDLQYTASEIKERYLPQFNLTLPTSQDQQNGQFTRYFCKKNNEIKYLEISKITYTKLSTQAPQIAWDLYTPVSLTWQITGNKNQVYASNKASAIAIEQNLKWYGFSQYFQDKFLKYYVES